MKIRLLVGFLFCSIVLFGCEQSDPNGQSDSNGQNGLNEQGTSSSQSSSASSRQTESREFDLEKQKAAYQLTRFEVLDISESPYDSGPALAVSFSVPLDTSKNIQDSFQVTDAKNKIVSGAWVVNDGRTRAYFQYIEPSQKYTVQVESSVRSINGQQLAKNLRKTIETSYLENSVRFTNKGSVLPSKLTRGLPVESVNIKEVDINFHRVFDEKIPQVIRERLDGYSYYVQGIPQYSELAYTARYTLDYGKNKKRSTVLPIHKISELQKPGFYIAVMKPAGEYPYENQVTSFYVSNLALHVTEFESSNNNRVSVHSMTIDKGETLSDVELEVVNYQGKILADAKTNDNGNHVFTNIGDAVVIGRLNNDFAVISLASPALDLSEQVSITRAQQDQELFMYGPRDLYRPGETIYINGILRDHDGQELPSVPLEAKLLRPDGRIATTFSWHPKTVGFYSKEINVSKSDPTGEWTLEVTHPSKSTFRYTFSVEEFLPERMKLVLTSEHDEFVTPLTNIQISGQGDYLYGAPAADNKIAARVTVKPNHFPVEKLKDFISEK